MKLMHPDIKEAWAPGMDIANSRIHWNPEDYRNPRRLGLITASYLGSKLGCDSNTITNGQLGLHLLWQGTAKQHS